MKRLPFTSLGIVSRLLQALTLNNDGGQWLYSSIPPKTPRVTLCITVEFGPNKSVYRKIAYLLLLMVLLLFVSEFVNVARDSDPEADDDEEAKSNVLSGPLNRSPICMAYELSFHQIISVLFLYHIL